MESEVVVPAQGKKITLQDGELNIPENPIIPYIKGDGIGVDVTPTMLKVVDAAVERTYKDERKISWMEIYTGEKSTQVYGQDVQLPAETLDLIHGYRVAIRSLLTTPASGGIHSLNVTLRRELNLYVCLRPIRHYQGAPSPVRYPELTDVVIFRENSEDTYAGIEWRTDSADVGKVIKFLREEMSVKKICFPEHCGIGIKPCPGEGTKRLVRTAIEYTVTNDRDFVTLVYRDNIMKFTEGTFKDWGYRLAREESGGELVDGGPWLEIKDPNTGKEIIIKGVIADTFLQQILLRPARYDVIACVNLNGDCISDALAAQVGGIGIAPNASTGDECALFEATHGIAPKYAGQGKVSPGSIILSTEMMLRHMGWTGAADLIIEGVESAINVKTIACNFERLMGDAKLLKCSEFDDVIIGNM